MESRGPLGCESKRSTREMHYSRKRFADQGARRADACGRERVEMNADGSVAAHGLEGPPVRGAAQEIDAWIEHTRTKADRNKRRARTVVAVVVGASAAIPVVLATVPNGTVQRAVASVLAALVVVVSSLSQLEHPHERWLIFRRYQRLLEAERTRYNFHLEPYTDEAGRDSELVRRTVELRLELHQNWETVVPSTPAVTGSPGGGTFR